MSASDNDQLVADYVRRLDTAARTLPADRRAELVEEITSHIAEARAADPGASGDLLAVRNILERLGDPEDIVRAAAEPAFADPGPGYPETGLRHDRAMTGPRGGEIRRGAGPLEIFAVLFLLIGGLVIPVLGWLVGLVLLWVSPRWQTKDKLIGTLVWPGGLLATSVVVVVAHAPSVIPVSEWLGITILVILIGAAIGGPIYTAVRLLRRAGRAPVSKAAEPAVPIPA